MASAKLMNCLVTMKYVENSC